MKRPRKPAKAIKTASKRGPAKAAVVSARMVEAKVPYLEVRTSIRISEASMVRLFEATRLEILAHGAKRVLLDGRESSVALSISAMNSLAKLVATLVGTLERLALVLRPQDILPEKFFEPSVTHRGLPTFVTTDMDDAVYWLSARFRPPR